MNRKQLGILLVLVVIIGGAGLVSYRGQKAERSSGNSGLGRKLLGDLPVNDLAHLVLRQGTNVVNLVKKDGTWRVAEREDYAANFAQLSEFLLKLRDLKATQTEQVGPSQLARLQLAPGQGPDSPTAVELRGPDDQSVATVRLGKLHRSSRAAASPMGESEGAGWPDGRYVQVGTNSGTVAVVSSPFENIEPQPASWLNKDFVRVEKPKSIEVIFPVATNSWRMARETESADWKLEAAKAGEELDAAKVSGVTGAFATPSFNDVLPGDRLAGSGTNAPTVVKIDTFDGFAYTIRTGLKTNDDYLVTVGVSAQLPKEREAGKEEKPEDKARLDKEFKDQQQKLADKLKLEQGFGKWTYLVSGWTVDALLKERSQLLVEKKPETGEPGVAPANSDGPAKAPQLEDPPMPAVQPNP